MKSCWTGPGPVRKTDEPSRVNSLGWFGERERDHGGPVAGDGEFWRETRRKLPAIVVIAGTLWSSAAGRGRKRFPVM